MRKCDPNMRTALLSLALLSAGCTAAKATIQIVSAEEALRRAGEYDAEQKAAYEYTMALRYLEKAREEAGSSEFRVADALARKSAEWSDRAIIFVERRGRAEIDANDLQEGPALPETAPPPAPPPAPDPALQEILGTPAPGEPATPPPEPAPAPAPDFGMDDEIEIPK